MNIELNLQDKLLISSIKIEPKGKLINLALSLKVQNVERLLKVFNLSKFNLSGTIALEAEGISGTFPQLDMSILNARLHSDNLVWVGKDLDSILEAYIDSKQVGLLATAGFLTMGPIGILMAKGVDLGKGGISGVLSGKTPISQLNAEVTLKENIINFKDTAVATKKNRVALSGSVDIKKDLELINVKVAALDKKDCSIFVQDISGTLYRPKIGVLKTAIGDVFAPALDVLKKTGSLLRLSCKPFYTGIVKHPIK